MGEEQRRRSEPSCRAEGVVPVVFGFTRGGWYAGRPHDPTPFVSRILPRDRRSERPMALVHSPTPVFGPRPRYWWESEDRAGICSGYFLARVCWSSQTSLPSLVISLGCSGRWGQQGSDLAGEC